MTQTTHVQTARRQLGELGAMEAQTERIERKILELAELLLEQIEKRIAELRPRSLTGDDGIAQQYQDAILERGRLQQVIAQAHANLT